jgi:hypothetical protein
MFSPNTTLLTQHWVLLNNSKKHNRMTTIKEHRILSHATKNLIYNNKCVNELDSCLLTMTTELTRAPTWKFVNTGALDRISRMLSTFCTCFMYFIMNPMDEWQILWQYAMQPSSVVKYKKTLKIKLNVYKAEYTIFTWMQGNPKTTPQKYNVC